MEREEYGYTQNVADTKSAPQAQAGSYYTSQVVVSDAVPKKNGSFAVGSLVCGVLGLLACWAVPGAICSIIGIILGIISLAKGRPQKGMAIGGIVMSSLALLLSFSLLLLFILIEG